MLCDFHIHTAFSGDCREPAEEQIRQAIRLGMPRICITDHHDYGDPALTLELDRYLAALAELRDRCRGQIRLELGVELGLQNRYAEELETIADTCSFDFIVGSHHYARGMDPMLPEFWAGKNEEAEIRHYFESVRERTRRLSCFDSCGHLDYIVRYCRTLPVPYDPSPYMDVIDEILQLLISRGKALECNTGGLRYAIRHTNPCMAILQRYRALGGELLTLGSDAHSRDWVGGGFESTVSLLRELGFRYYTVYHERKPEMLPLS